MSNIIRTYCQPGILSLYVLWRVWKNFVVVSPGVCDVPWLGETLRDSNQIAKRTFHSAQQFLFLWPEPPLFGKVAFKKRANPTRFTFAELETNVEGRRGKWEKKARRKLENMVAHADDYPSSTTYPPPPTAHAAAYENSKQSRTGIKMLRRKRWR